MSFFLSAAQKVSQKVYDFRIPHTRQPRNNLERPAVPGFISTGFQPPSPPAAPKESSAIAPARPRVVIEQPQPPRMKSEIRWANLKDRRGVKGLVLQFV